MHRGGGLRELHALRFLIMVRCTWTAVVRLRMVMARGLTWSQTWLLHEARMRTIGWQLVLELIRWCDVLGRGSWLLGAREHVLDALLLVLGWHKIVPDWLGLVRRW
jgi:hypothetical protein